MSRLERYSPDFQRKSDKSFDLSLLLLSTPAGARTLDTLIKSQVLYQLSYGCIISVSFKHHSC